MGLLGGLTAAAGTGPSLGLGFGLRIHIGWGLLGLLFAGLFAALTFGGAAYLVHYAVRAQLARARIAPWRYGLFLEAMTERLLLRRSGSAYLFVHRLLRDHLADREEGPPKEVGQLAAEVPTVLEERAAPARAVLSEWYQALAPDAARMFRLACLQLRRLDEAVNRLTWARTILHEMGDQHHEAAALNGLGLANSSCGAWPWRPGATIEPRLSIGRPATSGAGPSPCATSARSSRKCAGSTRRRPPTSRRTTSSERSAISGAKPPR